MRSSIRCTIKAEPSTTIARVRRCLRGSRVESEPVRTGRGIGESASDAGVRPNDLRRPHHIVRPQSRQRWARLITRDFRLPRRPDFGRRAPVACEFVHFGLRNSEPETSRGARSLDARRDNPRARPRRSARRPPTPPRWPTARDRGALNPLPQNAVRTPQNANAPAVRPGRSLLTCWRASFARAS